MAFVKEMAHINFGPFVSHNTIPNKQEFGTGVNIFHNSWMIIWEKFLFLNPFGKSLSFEEFT